MKRSTKGIVALLIAAVLIMSAADAGAARSSRKRSSGKAPRVKTVPAKAEPKPDISTICIEAESGTVLNESNADAPRPPASMVKMMLMLLVTEGIHAGKWTLETPITVTQHSENMGGTQVFLKAGESFPLGHLMLAIAVASANDAAMAVAEGLWGSEDVYKKCMNKRAAELGMKNSKFYSVHGLPPTAGQDVDTTTARDMAKLAQVLVKDPLVFTWTRVKELVFRPGEDPKQNTNKLLWQMDDCDGLKTGFINLAGFCVTATVLRNDIRLITVVMGLDHNQQRFETARQILETTYADICREKVIAKGQPLDMVVPVKNCETPEVHPTAGDDLWIVVKQSEKDKVKLVPESPPYLKTPVHAGAKLGVIRAELDGKTIGAVPLVNPAELEQARWHWKLMRSIH